MRLIAVWRLALGASLALGLRAAIAGEPTWQTLPPTPSLPPSTESGWAEVDGVRLYYATFGAGAPAILLHGGFANADYWGGQVPALAKRFRVIVMDTRGHGRSTRDAQSYTYELLANDVLGLMDRLKLPKAAIVGWSDGGITGLELAIHHPDRVRGAFLFAANYKPSGVREDMGDNPTVKAYLARTETEYRHLSATPAQWDAFLADIGKMWATEPNLAPEALRGIRVPIIIADGDHDEAIKRDHTEEMARLIPGAGLLIQPNVSHFSMLQDPEQFTEDVAHFLAGLQD